MVKWKRLGDSWDEVPEQTKEKFKAGFEAKTKEKLKKLFEREPQAARVYEKIFPDPNKPILHVDVHGEVEIEEDFKPPKPEENDDVEADLSDVKVTDKRKEQPPQDQSIGEGDDEEDEDSDEDKDEEGEGEGESKKKSKRKQKKDSEQGEGDEGEEDDTTGEGDEESEGEGGEGGQEEGGKEDSAGEESKKAKSKPKKGKGKAGGSTGEGSDEEGEPEEDKEWDGGDFENYNRDVEDRDIPNVMDGQLRLDATREEVEAAQQELKEMEDKAKAEAEAQAKIAQMSLGGSASGISTGVEEPHPPPDQQAYTLLVQENTPHITHLLNLLKQLQKVRWTTARFARRGRYMVELHPLFKAMAMGNRGKPFDRVFSGQTMHVDKVKTKMALLVDMSGSMNTKMAQDALTVIAETAGRWLPSEDFAIAVFGTNHQVVKAFVEPYHTARARIGSVCCMGATNMVRPLNVLIKMLASFRRSDYDLVLIIVSDFQPTDDEEENKRLMREAEKLGIKVVGIGLCMSDVLQVQQFTKRATFISQIQELPILFFKLYRATVSGMMA